MVYPLGYRRGYAWSIRSTPFGTPDQERALEQDRALAHAIRTFTKLDTPSDTHAKRIAAIVRNIQNAQMPSELIMETDLNLYSSLKHFFTRIARIVDPNAQKLTWAPDRRGHWGLSWNSPRYNRDFLIYPGLYDSQTYMIRSIATEVLG